MCLANRSTRPGERPSTGRGSTATPAVARLLEGAESASAQAPDARSELTGRILAFDGSPADGGPSVEWRGVARSRPASPDGCFQTGIKALDLFCPLPVSGSVEFEGGAGLGVLVLLGELSRRLHRRGGAAVWCAFERRGHELAAVETDLRELGAFERSCLVAARRSDGEAAHERAVHTALGVGVRLAEGGAPVAVILLADDTRREVVGRALRERPEGVSLYVANLRPTEGTVEPSAAFDARVAFDPELAAARLFPAIAPDRSTSRVAVPLGARHASVARAAREHLRATPIERGPAPDAVRQFLAQPFHSTTAFVGAPGEDAPLERVLSEVERLLDG